MFWKLMIIWALILGLIAVMLSANGTTPVDAHARGIITGLILLALYFAPMIIAHLRQHRNAMAIFVLNLFLGWTFIGWILSLVWACTNNREIAA